MIRLLKLVLVPLALGVARCAEESPDDVTDAAIPAALGYMETAWENHDCDGVRKHAADDDAALVLVDACELRGDADRERGGVRYAVRSARPAPDCPEEYDDTLEAVSRAPCIEVAVRGTDCGARKNGAPSQLVSDQTVHVFVRRSGSEWRVERETARTSEFRGTGRLCTPAEVSALRELTGRPGQR